MHRRKWANRLSVETRVAVNIVAVPDYEGVRSVAKQGNRQRPCRNPHVACDLRCLGLAGFAGLMSLRAGIAMSSLRQLVACSVLAVGVVGFSPALPLAYQSWHGPALAGREVCGAVASSRAAAIQPRSPRPHLGSARCLCASGDTWERWGDDGDISLWGEGLGIW